MTTDADGAHDFDRIARRHAPWIVRWLARRVPPGLDADDLAQDVLVVAYGKRSRLRDAASVRPYLVGIARRVLAGAVRKRARRARLLRLAPARRPAERPSAEIDRLDEAIRTLPEELAEVLDVYYSREVTYEEAAEVLGVPRATVQSRLRRAREALRTLLAEEEAE